MTPLWRAGSRAGRSPRLSLKGSLLGVACLLVFGGGALAQGRSWVDPPADLSAPAPVPPPDPAPVTPPAEARPQREAPRATAPPPARRAQAPARSSTPGVTAARQDAARRLAQDYLAAWSSQDEAVLEAMRAFYAPRVAFHGRMMSISTLMNEKRRFARRWPSRAYRHRPQTLTVACEPGATSCTVRSMFEFAASDPRHARGASGVGSLELVIAFAGDRPVIVAENSLIESRARTATGGDAEEDDLE